MRILIADADAGHRRSLASILVADGHDVIEAATSTAAWAALENGGVRVVLADAESTVIDALPLVRRLRAAALQPYAWVMLLTPRHAPVDVLPGLEAGADDFLPQPVRADELRARLRGAERVLALEAELAERTDRLSRVLREAERDLDAAARMQRALLPPTAPALPGLRAAWRFAPCRGVAGDVVGAHPLGEDGAAFYLVDVAGHGVPAAMLAFTLSRMLVPGRHGAAFALDGESSHAGSLLASPAELLASLNDHFPDDGENTRYFTAIYGVWDPTRRIARLAQAGHPAPIVQRGGALLPLVAEGQPIGLFPSTVYDELEIELQPDERLFLYSDGVTEARNANGEPFGLARLLDVLRGTRGVPLPQVAARVETALAEWHENTEPRDDITFLALEAA